MDEIQENVAEREHRSNLAREGSEYSRSVTLTKTLRAGRTQRTATATQAGSRSEPLVSATVGAHPPECCRRGFGQQAGSHGLGGLMQERTLWRSRFCGDNLKSLFRGNSSCQVCGRKIEMAMGLSHAFETRYRRRSLPGRPLYEDESERISIMARSH
jgi:hypothetical protein